MTSATRLNDKLLSEFSEITGFNPPLTEDFEQALRGLCGFLKGQKLRTKARRRRWLFSRVNWKFRINRDPIAKLYAAAAGAGVTFNYHQKAQIHAAFDLI